MSGRPLPKAMRRAITVRKGLWYYIDRRGIEFIHNPSPCVYHHIRISAARMRTALAVIVRDKRKGGPS